MTDRAHDKDTTWTDAKLPAYPPIAADHAAEVCVVGAGIAGLSAAYLLAKEGRAVVVLDDGAVAGGESGLTTAHLVTALDRRWTELAKVHSGERLRLAAQSHAFAINMIEHIVHEEDIDCDFRRVSGYLFAAPGDTARTLMDEVEAAHKAGLGDVVLVERAPLVHFDTGPALRFSSQAQFHPTRYLAGLARAIERAGGRIYTRAHVVDIVEEPDTGQVVVKTDGGLSVLAKQAFLAINTPFLPRFSLHLKQTAYRTYAIALQIPEHSIPPALYWDTEHPFHYVRVCAAEEGSGAGEYLIVGGEDHKSGQGDDEIDRHGRLEAWAREHFPFAGPVAHRWSGEVIETADGLAHIGPLKKGSRIMIATGDCGNGLTHGTIAGMLVRDLVADRPNDWASLYDPTRVNLSLQAASNYLREGLSSAAQLTDWLTPGDIDDPESLAPGEGAIMRKGLTKLAVYRDPQGNIHEQSAVCPHLGCIVAWNAVERTWDCPCHGSRFTCTGRVIHGPATADLKPLEPERATDKAA
jgi:glycine/D-amino acid oxidase-like deaminating enzyme/nitrite reductase/ring-hydroxylating ferredoxin subunit